MNDIDKLILDMELQADKKYIIDDFDIGEIDIQIPFKEDIPKIKDTQKIKLKFI